MTSVGAFRQNLIVVDRTSGRDRAEVRDTGITVKQILNELARGLDSEPIFDTFPQLTVDDVHAALAYAVESVESADREIRNFGWSTSDAAMTRHRLLAFAEDWDDPQMDVYDVPVSR